MNYKVSHNYLNLNFEIWPTIVIKGLIVFEISGRIPVPVYRNYRAGITEKIISWYQSANVS
jgi:hypothetical protein